MTNRQTVRSMLSETGWLDPVQTAVQQPATVDDLQCPDCDSHDIVMYEEQLSAVSVIRCCQCDTETRIDIIQLLDT